MRSLRSVQGHWRRLQRGHELKVLVYRHILTDDDSSKQNRHPTRMILTRPHARPRHRLPDLENENVCRTCGHSKKNRCMEHIHLKSTCHVFRKVGDKYIVVPGPVFSSGQTVPCSFRYERSTSFWVRPGMSQSFGCGAPSEVRRAISISTPADPVKWTEVWSGDLPGHQGTILF